MARTTKNTHVADICLYGNHDIGAGYLVSTRNNGILGDGEPKESRSMTEAVWLAQSELRLVEPKGRIRIFAAGGRMMAWLGVQETTYYGNLKWERAAVLTIDAADIEAAATS
jgi:hypothetical protein